MLFLFGFIQQKKRDLKAEIKRLEAELDQAQNEQYPMVLMAGERRAYTANTIYRDPEWRRNDKEGCLHINPEDAKLYGIADGQVAHCRSEYGSIEVMVEYHEGCRPGTCTIPNGYGLAYKLKADEIEKYHGPYANLLTGAEHCDELAKTPFHKYVPVALSPA